MTNPELTHPQSQLPKTLDLFVQETDWPTQPHVWTSVMGISAIENSSSMCPH